MKSVNKPVIPAEVADALDAARAAGMGNETLIDVRTEEFNTLVPGLTSAVLRSIPFDTFLVALVNGYEREMTEEERAHKVIREMYERHNRGDGDYETGIEDGAFAFGIRCTLNELGITIEGVNA